MRKEGTRHKAVRSEAEPPRRGQGTRRGKIFVISGPSGSGKTTLRDRLFSDPRLKRKLVKSVSLTTRPRRTGEKEGRDYFFVSQRDFLKGLKAKKILEWTKYLGHCYGTPKDFVDRKLKAGKHIVLCLDLKGVRQIRRLYAGQAVTVFVMPPSLEELRWRISGRCVKTKKEEISRRLALAKKELAGRKDFDFCVVNKNFTQALNLLKNFILRKIGS